MDLFLFLDKDDGSYKGSHKSENKKKQKGVLLNKTSFLDAGMNCSIDHW